MHPTLFEFNKFSLGGATFGPIKVHSFSVLLIIAFLASVWLARKRAPKFGFDPSKITDASMVVLFAGIIGARLLFILQELPYYLKHRDELFSLQFQGLTSFGALLFGFVAYAWFAWRQKRPLRDVLDVVAPSALLGHAIGRIGCLLNGCCYGVATQGGFGVHVDSTDVLHVPAQLFDSLMTLAALGLLLWIEKRGLHRGQSFSLFLVFYGVTRFIYEFWRAGTVEEVQKGIASSTYWGSLPITQAQGVALVMILVGAGMYLVLQRRSLPQQETAPA
ncbi:MAG: phosphatidylglycerol---prolipoprotein diacylglyceryl transferase [Fimbriimonadaceae bacterium]|jgi:phosphatidylglycerol:prolipoprotein diacylglycerol transferase|nr:phosphatidylglycerol---prolipoprotein diacylglyceryl transferase [Fimbriimonadaceae bacterium]